MFENVFWLLVRDSLGGGVGWGAWGDGTCEELWPESCREVVGPGPTVGKGEGWPGLLLGLFASRNDRTRGGREPQGG